MRAIRAGRAFDGERALDGGATVLLDGGRIEAVLPAAASVPAGVAVDSFPAATVLPGLIDTHVHLGGDNGPDALDRLASSDAETHERVIADNLERQLAAGVTAVRDLGDLRWSVVDWRDRHRSGSAPALPTVLAAGPPLTSERGHCWFLGGEVSDADAIRRAVRERAERAVDVVKIMLTGGAITAGSDVLACQFPLTDVRLVVDEAHAAGLPVVAHAHGLPGVEQAVAAGVDGIEHCSCLTEAGIALSAALLETLCIRRTVVGPTLGRAPGMEPPPGVLAMMARTGVTYELRQAAAARMHSAGVRLVSGVDSGIGPGKPHGLLPLAVADLALGGVPVPGALASATSVAAEACGLGACKGRLRAGYDADLLLVGGDPLADVTRLGEVEAVFLLGSRVR